MVPLFVQKRRDRERERGKKAHLQVHSEEKQHARPAAAFSHLGQVQRNFKALTEARARAPSRK